MLHRREPEAGRVDRVEPRYVELSVVARCSHLVLSRLVDRCAHNIGSGSEKLDPVGAHARDFVDPGAGFGRCGDGLLEPETESGIGFDAWRRDRVGEALFFVVHDPTQSVPRARVTDRRDAVAHPELENIFCRCALLVAADVPVQVHETREHVVALELHHFVAGTCDRAVLFIDRDTGNADALDLGDAVAFDHDVHRADCGGAGAVD